ncbi:MAG: pentapeptide repeat-containing protein [Candidatus Melainabacteria bacterium]|nr:pentapeptide repeat-containing protein [Candidatus Melainabacteria bacterium]
MQNLKTYIEKNGPLPWQTCTRAFASMLDKISGDQLVLPLNLASFQIDEASKEISLAESVSQSDTAYQSPEFCLERPCDERSIIYSLGCVLYACMTGSPAFLDRTQERISEMQVSEDPRPLSRRILNEQVPGELDSLLERAMRKNPKKRFGDTASLRTALLSIESFSDQEDQREQHKKHKENIFKYFAFFALVPAFAFFLSHNDYTQKLIADSHPQARHPYHLSLDSSDYRLQMEFDDNKTEADKSKKQIRILNMMTKKIMFATTKRKTFKAALEEAVRRQLDLKGADLSGQDLVGANLHGARFAKAFFINSNLNNVNLYSCFLDGADFRGASMKNCMLSDVHAVQANFSEADLSGSQMVNSVFLQSNFMDAKLNNCNLSGAKLNQAKMVRADLTGATTKNTIRSANFWDGAIVNEAQIKAMETVQSVNP